MTPQQMVAEFHDKFGLPVRRVPAAVTPAERDLRQALLEEEACEACEAMEANDVLKIAQELADVVYVAYGAALTYGIDLDAAVAEVHRANMSKIGPDGRPLYREDGKVLKGPGYTPPNMAFVLERQRRGRHTDPPVPPAIGEALRRAFR